MFGTHRISWIKIVFALFLIAGLPIFIWAVVTQRIELRKRAATAEPTEICWNRVISFNNNYNWPNSCKGSPRTDLVCAQILVPLSPAEITGYESWISAGKPYIPGCGGPTPTPTQRCTSDTDCPAGYICSATPPGGCPITIINGIEGRTACAAVPRCWAVNPTATPVSCAPNGKSCTITICPTMPPCPVGKVCTQQMPSCITQPGICQNNRCVPTYPTLYQSPTPTPTPNCTPYPACYYPVAPDQPRCTLFGNVNYCPPMPVFTLSVNVAVPELLPNQVMPLTINVREYDGSAGTPTEGFNVQVAVDTWPLVGTPSVFSQNAYFDANTQLWVINIPRPQNVGMYRLQVHAYCGQDNSLCAIRYGQARQLEWTYYFSAVIPQPQNLTFKVKLAGVNGAEAKGATITVKLKLKDGTVLPLDKPLVLDPVGNGVYSATATLTNPLPSGTAMRVLVKGEKHSQIVFCRASGQTDPCNDTEYISPSSYSFDFTGRPLPAGDLNQDGKVNADDLKFITDLFKKPSTQLTVQDLKSADVDYSGTIDAYDLNLVLQTLETRYDEQ